MSMLLLTTKVSVASTVVESLMSSRSFASSLFTGYPSRSIEPLPTPQERVAPLPPPPVLSAQLQYALFTLASRKPTNSKLAALILEALRKSTVMAGAFEYSELMRLGYATREQGTSYHAITPAGRFLSDRLAKIAAKQLGIHHFRTWSDIRHNHILCESCGWSHAFSADLHHVRQRNGEWMALHLQEARQARATIEAGRPKQEDTQP